MSSVALWSGRAFHEEVTAWVDRVCGEHGIALTGEREQPHVRPWSSAIRFGSDAGLLWFKVNGAGTVHEGSLVGVLAALEPDLVPEVLAVEPQRGWWLSRDAGPVLRSTAPPEELWDAWEAILLRYAEAQLRLAGQVEALLSTGVAEVSPATLPELAATLVKRLGAMSPEEGGLTAAEQGALAGRLPEYAAWCAELEASGIPSSIQHDDLHSSNICSGGSADTARIIDWGDASVGFPLATMLCTMNSLAWHARVELDDPRVVRVRDAYLEPFTRFADRESLVRYVGLARRTGCVARALSYEAALREEPLATHVEQDFPVRGWLLEMLAD